MATRRANPTIRQRHLRRALRELRTRDGRTAQAVAQSLGWSVTRLTRLETTSTRPKPETVQQLLDEYRITEPAERAQVLDLVTEAREHGWWHAHKDALEPGQFDYVGLEDEASGMRTFETHMIPTLLQTPEYAKAAIRGQRPGIPQATFELHLQVRMRRQQVLSGEHPLTMWAILDEAVLRRTVGGPQVMRDQLTHLLQMGRRDHIHLQVLPFGKGAHPGVSPFIVLDFAHSVDPEVVYLRTVGRSICVEDVGDVVAYRMAFEDLIEAALNVIPSRKFISKLLTELP